MDTASQRLYSQECLNTGRELPLVDEAHVSDPLIGKIISERYRVLERVGQGGFGAVYKVQHIRLDKTLALKVLFEHTHQNPRMIKRFEREARATCRIGHDNIVEITDFARDRRVGYYFVMEYLVGETLCDRLRKLGPISVARTVHIGCQIADALAATHTKGIVHRDLKPDNIFLVRKRGEEDFVKVLDFGIAAMGDLEEEVPRLTRHGMMLGTPAYMSPEQAEGKPPDHRADIYSLGIILYEMATGSVPFKNAASMAVLEMHRSTPPVPPRSARPDLNIAPGLEQVILRALRKPVGERYQTMREIYNDLVNLSQSIDMSSVLARRPEVLVEPLQASATDIEPEEPQWIDEDLVLLEEASPMPQDAVTESQTVREKDHISAIRITEERGDEIDVTELIEAELNYEMDSAHELHSDVTSSDRPPSISIQPQVVGNTMPAATLELPTQPPLANQSPAAGPSSEKPFWHSAPLLVLVGFLVTIGAWAAFQMVSSDSTAAVAKTPKITTSKRSTQKAVTTESPAAVKSVDSIAKSNPIAVGGEQKAPKPEVPPTNTGNASGGVEAQEAKPQVVEAQEAKPQVVEAQEAKSQVVEAQEAKSQVVEPQADKRTVPTDKPPNIAPSVQGAAKDSAGQTVRDELETVQTPQAVRITIKSEPSGARVSWLGQDRGITPVTLEIPRTPKALTISAKKPGYLVKQGKVIPESDQTLVLKLKKRKRRPDYKLYQPRRGGGGGKYKKW